MVSERKAWVALGTLCIGFFMILVDMTIVAVANPAIMTALHTDINDVIWVTSAYLLSYAVPLLLTGRLGDMFGPKKVFLTGLAVFTLASLWCGLSGSIGMLIAARAVQGLGAALITPQTMAVITRIFPPQRRGAAMGVWGAVAGVATLVGPIAGGVLVDHLGWEWIFFVNVPVGLVGFVLALRFVPTLETHDHQLDLVGVALSGAGLFLLVFGLQEGNSSSWAPWIWLMIAGGLLLLVAFIWSQARGRGEPLLPLGLFADRNFALANIAISAMGAAVTAMMLPMFFYAEAVRGLSPTRAALVFAPMAVVSGVLAPVIGRQVDRLHPRYIPVAGFSLFVVGLLWLAALMDPSTPIWQLLMPATVLGVASACIWAPLGATATRNLPMRRAGAGAGVYNTTRQVASVLGSAAISALITARLAAQGIDGSASEGGGSTQLPELLRAGFSTALAESMLLPAGLLLIGVVASAMFASPRRTTDTPSQQPPAEVTAPSLP